MQPGGEAMSQSVKYARIVVGSKTSFRLYLVDENGRPVSLSPYSAGKLAFLNGEGTRTLITLDVPGDNPDRGMIEVEISAAQAADADGLWVNADLELTEGADTVVVPLKNKFEIVNRYAPAAS
jgi:hypothetical protein